MLKRRTTIGMLTAALIVGAGMMLAPANASADDVRTTVKPAIYQTVNGSSGVTVQPVRHWRGGWYGGYYGPRSYGYRSYRPYYYGGNYRPYFYGGYYRPYYGGYYRPYAYSGYYGPYYGGYVTYGAPYYGYGGWGFAL